MAYFQVPWAEKHGALQTFGVEAAIVTGLFLLIVPALQLKGSQLRVRTWIGPSPNSHLFLTYIGTILDTLTIHPSTPEGNEGS